MFKKGQKVWGAMFGPGEVKRIHQQSGEKYPVLVRFNDELNACYTSDGKFYAGGNATLFPYPVEITKVITKDDACVMGYSEVPG